MSPNQPIRVGVIGCGAISDAYFRAMRSFPQLHIAACADLNPDAAHAAAAKWDVAPLTVAELLARDDIALILNLTTPQAHAPVTLDALRAGKHVHLEKPLALDRAAGQAMLAAAAQHRRRIGCAPDTFLGGGLQTCRRLLDDGAIGRVVAGTAFMQGHGPEGWHPRPAFYYMAGGGPLFDMGPYYLTALVHLLGPIRRVAALGGQAFATRHDKHGNALPVEVLTHVAGTLEFAGGALVTLVMSFDVWAHGNPPIELHGTTGSLRVPDPNTFGGPVALWTADAPGWRDMPLTHGHTTNMRGIGAADLARALLDGRPHRCHSDLAYHVLDAMQALHESAESGHTIALASTCERPAALPVEEATL